MLNKKILSILGFICWYCSPMLLQAQCTWHNILTEGFEYNTPCPHIFPGTTYTSIPQSWAVHSGNTALYMNFVNCVGQTGTCAGDTFYSRPIPVCPSVGTRISTYFATTFAGSQCDIKILLVDTLNIVVASMNSLVADYAPLWTYYQSPVVFPLSTTLRFVLITNNAGSPNGNDLSMDDFMVENCYKLSLPPDTTLCKGQTVQLMPDSNYNAYMWNNGATTATITAQYGGPGTDTSLYYVTVTTGGGCQFTSDTSTVYFVDCGGINFIASDTSFCEKQCIDFFDLSQNGPTSWQWTFTGGTPASSTSQNPTAICYNNYGSFDVTLIACNAQGCDTLTLPSYINEHQNPPAPPVTQSNDTLFCLATNVAYQWYFNNVPITNANSSFIIASQQGLYYVLITDTNGCAAASNAVVITSVPQVLLPTTMLTLWPQSQFDTYHISWPSSYAPFRIDVANAMGQVVYSQPLTTTVYDTSIPAALGAPGIYFVLLHTNRGILRARLYIP